MSGSIRKPAAPELHPGDESLAETAEKTALFNRTNSEHMLF